MTRNLEWRTVRLELVRVGPTHNQLISPLTTYIALCNSLPPQAISLPLEHRALEHHLSRIRYGARTEDDPADRQHHREVLAGLLVGVLRQIQGLKGAIDEATRGGAGVELRIITGAAELQLLPFELAMDATLPDPLVAPGVRVVVVRETRSLAVLETSWPDYPRILVGASDAGGFVPLENVLLAVRDALRPYFETAKPSARHLAEMISIEPTLSLKGLQARLANPEGRQYTHLVLLAHGGLTESGAVLLLSGQNGAVDRVDGGRLGSALGANMPGMVMLAACDAGARNDVRVGGIGSLAMSCHLAGVPLVVASQLPLSFMGAYHMVHKVLKGGLEVRHPADCLFAAREAMRVENGGDQIGGLDWASLVAYGRWPAGPKGPWLVARRRQLRRRLQSIAGGVDPWQRIQVSAPGIWEDPAVPGWDVVSKACAQLQSLFEEVGRLAREDDRAGDELLHSWAGNLRRAVGGLMYHRAKGKTLTPAQNNQVVAWLRASRQEEERRMTLGGRLQWWNFSGVLLSRKYERWVLGAEEGCARLESDWILAAQLWLRLFSDQPEGVNAGVFLALCRPSGAAAVAGLPSWIEMPSVEECPDWSKEPNMDVYFIWATCRHLYMASLMHPEGEPNDWAKAWLTSAQRAGAPLKWDRLRDYQKEARERRA
jgi:hypothetical protein